jgi:hypothetical protein
MRHLMLGLVVELDRERDQNLGEQGGRERSHRYQHDGTGKLASEK